MIGRIKKSLTLKWMAFSILLATVPLAIGGFSILRIYQEDLKKSIIEIEKEKAQMVVERTQDFFVKALNNLLLLSRYENFGKGGLSSTREHFEAVLYSNDYLVELTLLDKKGQETFKVSKYTVFDPADLKNQSKSKMFEVASKGDTYYGKFHLTRDVVPTLVIAVPIEESRRGPFAVVSAKVHLRYLWDLLPQTQFGKEGSTYVVNKEGDLIAHPDTRRVLLGLNVKDLPMVKEAITGKEGYFEFEHPQGERDLVVYKPIRGLGWGVIVQVPVKEAYKPLRQLANTALKWILFALTIAIILSLFLTKKLTLPIKRLTEEMGEVAKGNLNTYIKPTSKDEVGLLTESFNHMIQDLKQSHESLKKAEEKYRRIFENSKDMVYITSVDGKFIDVNQAGIEMLGYENKEELFEIAVGDTYFNPEERNRFQSEIVKEGFVKDFEVKLERKDGTPIDVLITASVRKDAEGHISGYEGIIKDISVRRRMEEEIFQRTEELQTLHDLSILINQTLDLNKFFPTALERILSLMGFEMGAIFLYDEDKRILELKFNKGYSPSLAESVKVLKFGEGIAGKALELKKTIVFSINGR
jgi:PAS domain S-box-containing protein